MAQKSIATFAVLALCAGLFSLVFAACSSDDAAVADTADSSSSGSVTVSDSAQDAVSELLGDISSSDPAVTAERVNGVAYSQSEPGVMASSVDTEHNLLRIKLERLEGGRVAMKNGGAVRLREGLVAEIFVDPFPTNTLTAWLDLYLHDGNDVASRDATVVIDYDMFSMGHGPFFTTADMSPNGHYTFRLDYVMFGAWEQILKIQDPQNGDEHVLEVVVIAVP
ncbi:MAG: hypothetical protein QF357_04310 [Dehalococcoidia bacterium]|nr:hypothetical protein [Dehalococcoidia bacterium]